MRRLDSSRALRLLPRGFPSILLGLLPASVLACAQLLSYDDYQERPIVSSDAAVEDSAPAETIGDADDGPARPPARPLGTAAAGGGKVIWTAIKRYYLGHLDPEGKATAGAWRHWGYDIDRICTSAADSVANIGTCLRPPGAPRQDFLMDGERCRDNNFGQHIVALLDITSDGFEENLNKGVLAGTSTWVLRLDDLGAEKDDPYVPGRLYRVESEKGTALAPKWDGNDVRRALADSVLNRNIETPVANFPKGYVTNDVWVSGEPSPQRLILSADSKVKLALGVEATVFTMNLDAAHTTATSGVLAGVLPIATIDSVIGPAAASGGICSDEPLYMSILEKVRTYPDVTVGIASLQDLTKQCDGISIGLGFTFAPIKPITTLADPEPGQPGECDDAGVDAGSDAAKAGG